MISFRGGGEPGANRPSSGVRFVLERAEAGEGYAYVGFAHLPDREVPIALEIDAAGAVRPKAAAGSAREPEHASEAESPGLRDRAGDASFDAAALARDAAALVRAAVKAAKTADRPPPRRIVRWRG